MDFKNFLQPYMQSVKLISVLGGGYVDGVWFDGETVEVPFKAVITNFADDVLQFSESGTYTTDDEKMYTYKKLSRGQKVVVQGLRYTITEERDYSFYGKGLRMFVIRRDGVDSN